MKLVEVYQEISNNISETILIFDKNGKIVLLNDYGMKELGYTEDDFIDVKTLFAKSLKDAAGMPEFNKFDQIQEFVAENKGHVFDMTIYRKNHICFPAEVRFGILSIIKETFYICSIRNVTEKVEMIKELTRVGKEAEESLRAKSEFVANVTHELRTPVNGIEGHIQFLLENPKIKQETRQTLEVIDQCCVNMSRIINNILDFSKMEAGKFELEEKEFDIRKCFQFVIDSNVKIANEKGISLTYRIADDVPQMVIGDELRVTQIMNNLVSNALKFTTMGYVKIEVTEILYVENDLELFIMVTDSGIGMKEDVKEKIFESFYQENGSATRKYGGTGLGLSVTKELVEMMNGKLNCESVPGKGSTFSFSIFLKTKEKATRECTKALIDTVDLLERTTHKAMNEINEHAEIYHFGTPENIAEINSNMEKMIICIEMGTWYRAEEFADNIKTLIQKSENEEYKKKIFRLEMAVRKENYDKSTTLYKEIKKWIEELEQKGV